MYAAALYFLFCCVGWTGDLFGKNLSYFTDAMFKVGLPNLVFYFIMTLPLPIVTAHLAKYPVTSIDARASHQKQTEQVFFDKQFDSNCK